jgi:hypothetical protein
VLNFSDKVKSIQQMNKKNREWKEGILMKNDQGKFYFNLKINQGDAELIKVISDE